MNRVPVSVAVSSRPGLAGKTGSSFIRVFLLLVLLLGLLPRAESAEWVPVTGKVMFGDTPVCAMVLANGQNMFSCSGDGSFNLSAPLDSSGQVTLFAFAQGFAPFRQTLSPAQVANISVNMERGTEGRTLTVDYSTSDSQRDGWTVINGTIDFNGTPVCALMLANGQHMFSCNENLGSFSLEVPVDSSGNVTLFAFVSGFQPFKVVFPVPGGGVSGTGIGTITAFGSVIINDIREFGFDDKTRFFRDGDEVTEAIFIQDGAGMVSRVEIGDDISANFTSGTAVTVSGDNVVKGPVTGINPLQVLEQTVVVTGDTVLDNMPGNDMANLVPGDIVEVSGFANGFNVIQTTRLEFKGNNNAGVPVWKLTGPVSNVIANTSFQVGAQRVVLNGVVPRDCDAGLANGDFVEVKATADPGFTAGEALDTVTDVECKVTGLGVPADATGKILNAEIEGIVTTVTAPDDFIVNGQRVRTNVATRYEGGTAEDIVVGVKLEAEGDFDTDTRILTADKIRFRETRVRIEAPLTVPAGGLDGSFTIMDVITVNTTALTDDDDGLVDGSGPSGSMQVEVRGFVDGSGAVIATEVRERGSADINDVRLRGPIDTIVNPTFEILGVRIDTATATSIFDDTVSPAQSINATTFFNRVSNGTPVQVEDGTFNSGPPFITSGDIEIED